MYTQVLEDLRKMRGRFEERDAEARRSELELAQLLLRNQVKMSSCHSSRSCQLNKGVASRSGSSSRAGSADAEKSGSWELL